MSASFGANTCAFVIPTWVTNSHLQNRFRPIEYGPHQPFLALTLCVYVILGIVLIGTFVILLIQPNSNYGSCARGSRYVHIYQCHLGAHCGCLLTRTYYCSIDADYAI
jgi:hypothetical protein